MHQDEREKVDFSCLVEILMELGYLREGKILSDKERLLSYSMWVVIRGRSIEAIDEEMKFCNM